MNKTEELKNLLISRFAETVEYGAMCEECCSSQGNNPEKGEMCELSEKPLQPDDYCPQQILCIDTVIPDIEKICQAEIDRIKQTTWCAYCGKEYPLDTLTADQIGEHIAICEKHPLYQANKEIARLREGWAHCADLCRRYEQMIEEMKQDNTSMAEHNVELETKLDQVGSKLDEQVVYYGDVIASKNDRIKELETVNKELKILADMRQT